MRTVTRRIALLSCLASLALPACGGSESGPTGSGTDNYLPFVSAFWSNVVTPSHTLTLLSEDNGKATGSFTGTESRAGVESTVTGTFRNSKASFAINRANGTYGGTFYGAGKDSLRLTLGSETLVFKRQL